MWFGKYITFFIFQDTVFLTHPENHDNKEGFCFLNWGTKTKCFLDVKVKNNFNMMHISFSLKQLSCCCLDIIFFSLILLGVTFVIQFSYMFFFFLWIDILRIFLYPTKYKTDLVLLYCLFLFLFYRWCLSTTLETLNKTWAILKIELISLKVIGHKN